MTTALRLADAGETADLAAFLARLIHYDRAAAVRLQAGGGVLAVFGRPASFEVLAIRTARLGGPAAGPLDATVSAGQLADALDAALGEDGDGGAAAVALPEAVTGPPWAGVLPPRGGWRRVEGLPGPEGLRGAVAACVKEFRARTESLPEERRTRAELDRVGREIWSRTVGATDLPLRAVHAAQSLGFLRPPRPPRSSRSRSSAVGAEAGTGATATAVAPAGPPSSLALLVSGGWLRLRTPYGSIAVRGPGGGPGLPGLTVTPV